MRIGVLTSGGDAPGMNAAVRGAVRAAFALGAEVYVVQEGYAGLVAGGDQIHPCVWGDVSNIMQLGGTSLGTARCAAFRSPDGRRLAVKHAIEKGLSRLLIIGGDGSLTGADVLRSEWPSHVEALLGSGDLVPAQTKGHEQLLVVGAVGSIDNDMWGTDMTIGCDSAMHRIVDAMDTLTSTARSHQRSFVLEVMGRHCGYLALAAAICGAADYVLLPEAPEHDWQKKMGAAIAAGRDRGKRKSLVVLAEGACDVDGEPITAEMVRAAIEAETDVEARITNLGHVQRGGTPSAYDRVMSTVLGTQGAARLMSMAPGAEPLLMTTRGHEVIDKPLMECVRGSKEVARAIAEKRFDDAIEARGTEFAELLQLQRTLVSARDLTVDGGKRLLIAHIGAPAPGMNAAVRAFGRVVADAGHQPLVALEGLHGMLNDQLRPLDWLDTEDIASAGSAVFGTHRWWPQEPHDVVALDAALTRHDIEGVVLVGGFECLRAAAQLQTMGLPVAVVPATISNNLPATDRSLGCDTAENAICEAVDRLKQSAIGSRRRVFVVEVMGRACGYLAAVTGIGTGAETVYTNEEGIDLKRLETDVAALTHSFEEGREVGLVLVADAASDAYDANALSRIYQGEARGRFDTRLCVLGHLQQGGRPAPRDRVAAARLAARAATHVATSSGAVVFGIDGDRIIATPCLQALDAADLEHRRPKTPPHQRLVTYAKDLTDVVVAKSVPTTRRPSLQTPPWAPGHKV